MALPTTISGTMMTGHGNWFCGPFLSSGGNVYVVLLDTTNAKLHVYKATDPASSFTERDSAHIPAQIASGAVWARQDGDILSIAGGTQSTTPAYKFHQFSMATDLWSATIKDKAINSPTIAADTFVGISLVKRSDASFVAVFQGPKETLMGGGFNRQYYSISTDGGATWGTAVAFTTAGVKRDQNGAIAVLGASDRVHFFYIDGNNSLHRSLSSSNVLDTQSATITADAGTGFFVTPGVSYVSGANTVVKVAVMPSSSGKLTNIFFNSGANPSISTNPTYSDGTVNAGASVGNSAAIACHVVDGTTVHSLFSDLTTFDLMHDKQTDGGAWGTDVNEWTAVINQFSANVFTRSGNKVIGIIADDNGTMKYNEISLATATPLTQTCSDDLNAAF